MKFKLVILVTLYFSFCSLSSHANEETPGKIVKQTVEKVLSVLKDESLDEEKRKEREMKEKERKDQVERKL